MGAFLAGSDSVSESGSESGGDDSVDKEAAHRNWSSVDEDEDGWATTCLRKGRNGE